MNTKNHKTQTTLTTFKQHPGNRATLLSAQPLSQAGKPTKPGNKTLLAWNIQSPTSNASSPERQQQQRSHSPASHSPQPLWEGPMEVNSSACSQPFHVSHLTSVKEAVHPVWQCPVQSGYVLKMAGCSLTGHTSSSQPNRLCYREFAKSYFKQVISKPGHSSCPYR